MSHLVGHRIKLGSVVLAASTPTLDLANIPASCAHLEVIVLFRSDRAGAAGDDVNLAINGDTTDANYDRQYAQANISAASAQEAMGASGSRWIGRASAANAPANHFGQVKMLVTDYAGSAYKLVRAESSVWTARSSGGLFVRDAVVGWASTAAVNRITLAPALGSNLLTGSRMDVYGVV